MHHRTGHPLLSSEQDDLPVEALENMGDTLSLDFIAPSEAIFYDERCTREQNVPEGDKKCQCNKVPLG